MILDAEAERVQERSQTNHSLRGKYKGKGLLKALMEEKKREREL